MKKTKTRIPSKELNLREETDAQPKIVKKSKLPISTGTMFTGDNLPIMRGFESETIDLIATDPPFNSNRNYEAPIGSGADGAFFQDIWFLTQADKAWMESIAKLKYPKIYEAIRCALLVHSHSLGSYLIMMAQRLIEMHRILKPTGSLYLHCDQTAGHYLKIMLDSIFGKDNFLNDFIWCYKENETATKYFPRKHDNVFLYRKSKKFIFNIQRGDITEAQMKRYNHIIDGERYANMKGKMRKLKGGAKLRDWIEIPIVQDAERTDYPTQKPLALYEIFIKSATNEGDIVLDPFCGCATTCVAAEKLLRKWIGIDISEKANELVRFRLVDELGFSSLSVRHRTDVPERKNDIVITPKAKLKKRLFGEQEGKCNHCKNSFTIEGFDIDHIVPKSIGGHAGDSNKQLLCRRCNTSKGNKEDSKAKANMREMLKNINIEIDY